MAYTHVGTKYTKRQQDFENFLIFRHTLSCSRVLVRSRGKVTSSATMAAATDKRYFWPVDPRAFSSRVGMSGLSSSRVGMSGGELMPILCGCRLHEEAKETKQDRIRKNF